jgi:hypothetical protein
MRIGTFGKSLTGNQRGKVIPSNVANQRRDGSRLVSKGRERIVNVVEKPSWSLNHPFAPTLHVLLLKRVPRGHQVPKQAHRS